MLLNLASCTLPPVPPHHSRLPRLGQAAAGQPQPDTQPTSQNQPASHSGNMQHLAAALWGQAPDGHESLCLHRGVLVVQQGQQGGHDAALHEGSLQQKQSGWVGGWVGGRVSGKQWKQQHKLLRQEPPTQPRPQLQQQAGA